MVYFGFSEGMKRAWGCWRPDCAYLLPLSTLKVRRQINHRPNNTPSRIPRDGPQIHIKKTWVEKGWGNCSNTVANRLSVTSVNGKANERRETSIAATVPARMEPAKTEA